jgi:hypothetical protein
MPQLPHSVELHDSKLVAIRHTPEGVTLELRPSYVRRDGKGWRQNADIQVVGASVGNTVAVPVRIADGELKIPRGPYHNLLMLPLSEPGPVQMKLALESGELIELHGAAIAVHMLGEPVFVEHFQ